MTRRPGAWGATLAALAITVTAGVARVDSQTPAAPQAASAPPTAARPPAASLVRPTAPSKSPDRAGFIQRWLVLDPIRVSNQLTESAVQAAVGKYAVDAVPPVPRDGQTLTVDGETRTWQAVDTRGYNLNLFHFAYARNKPTSNVLFWVVTVVHAPRDLPGVRLAIGSNAASVWWLGGQQVITLYNDRQAVIDDGVSARVTLRKGPNVIRAAIVNAGGATDFCARFLDENGQPVTQFTIDLAPRSPQP